MKQSNMDRATWNRCRFTPGDRGGHYESYFQRANHPEHPLAFWIRYTIFSPKDRPGQAVGELWAIYFNGESGKITAVKETTPIANCQFSETDLDISIGGAILSTGGLEGHASSKGHKLQWSLDYEGDDRPLLLLPESFYEIGFPKAKALVGTPNAIYRGSLLVDGEQIEIDGWIGSQNHNWGSKHTDSYAWAQVSGFDNAPDATLECSTARVRIGPLWTPWFTLVVLRIDGKEYAFNNLYQALRAKGRFDFFNWHIDTRTPKVRINAKICATASQFVGLCYDNPPGGEKTCLNTKLASCELTLELSGHSTRTLISKHRAAFEILTDREDHGVPVEL